MKITVITSPDPRALEAETMRLMKRSSAASKNGVVAIVPDQSSFSEEERLIGEFGVTGLGNPEALSFKRLFYKLRPSFPSGRRRLTASAREMAVMHALADIKAEDFRLFRGVVKKRDLTSTVSAMIAGFKRYGVTGEKLRAAEEGLENAMPLKRKLHDCVLALESYNSLMDSGSLCDADDDMQELLRILSLPKCRFFEGKTVCISHFSDLNVLQRRCVGLMAARADNVFAAVCWDDRPEFATTGKLIDGLARAAYDVGADFARVAVPAASGRPPQLAFLSEHFYGGAEVCPVPAAPAISLHISRNPFEEVRRLAASISRAVRGGLRYRDITVAARNVEAYSGYIKRIFPIYSIPVFLDMKRPLERHSAARFLLSAMELAIYGFRHENVFAFAKNPFAPHGGRCGELEDYCVEAGVRSWNWGEDFTFIRGSYNSKSYGAAPPAENLDALNERRREIWELIEPLRLCLSKERAGEDFARGLYDFILKSGLPENSEKAAVSQEENGDPRGAAETRQVYDLLIDILDDIYTVFGSATLTPEELYDAVKTACSAVQIGVVPPSADSVIFGDPERMKGSSDRVVFLLGLNEDVFPRSFSNTSIFTEAEAELLSRDFGVELPPGVAAKTENENFLVYEALSSAKERLCLSCPIASADGGSLRPSRIVKRVRELFPKLIETEDVSSPDGEYLCVSKPAAFLELGAAVGEERQGGFWNALRGVLAADAEYGPRLRAIFAAHSADGSETEPLDAELLKKALGGELALSPSSLEAYASCPFSYFAHNVLRLRELTPMNINPTDSGNLLHNIIDGFCAVVAREKHGDWSAVSDDYAETAFKSVCAEIRLGLSRQIAADPRLAVSVARIERMARKCIEEIRTQIEEELFVPTGAEVVIDENGSVPPSRFVLPDGKSVRFRGRIDRADIRRGVKIEEDGRTKIVDLVRIVDYKSSGKEISFNKVLHGLQLQLFAYMDSYLEAEPQSRPAAALYFNLTETPVEAEIGGEPPEKRGRFTGVSVKGRMAERRGVAALEEREMKTLLRYVKKSIKRTAERIYAGEVPVSPVRAGGRLNCDFCPYMGVCKIEDGAKARNISKDNGHEAIEEMEKELEADSYEA